MPATADVTVSSTLADSELLRIGTRSGPQSEKAWSELVQRHRPRLLNLIRSRYSVPDTTAEEIVQDALRKLYEHAHRYDRKKGSVLNYLSTIASNLAKNGMRNDSRDPTTPISAMKVSANRGDRPWLSTAADLSARSRPDRRVEIDDLERTITDEINRLPDHYAPVIRLRRGGESYKRIAEITGLTVGTVKSRLARGRKKLKERLRDREIDPEKILDGD